MDGKHPKPTILSQGSVVKSWNNLKTIDDFKEEINKKHPELDKAWKQIVREVGAPFVNFLKEKINTEISFLKELSQFSLRLVVDNNFVFGQIRGAIKGGKNIEDSFLFKIMLSTSVKIFAPPRLAEELLDKIDKLLKEEDKEVALNYAGILLSKIDIQDAKWIDDWKKAQRFIGDKDDDDVPYLALAFHIGSHAIISFDQVFHNQGDINVWQFEDTDRIITNYHSGYLSFALIGGATTLLFKVISIIGKIFLDAIKAVAGLMQNIITGSVNAISKLPKEVLIIGGVAGLIALLVTDDIGRKSKDFSEKIFEAVRTALKAIEETTRKIIEIIGNLIEQAKPLGIPVAEFLGYLLTQFAQTQQELALLEKHEAHNLKVNSNVKNENV